ncbi:MAG: CvpA family protein [Candidatus Choladocola sp.]|nr:CvpA family protein [Candidatus Choladocola sp.]
MNIFDFRAYTQGADWEEVRMHRKPRQPRAPKGNPFTRVLFSILITLIFGGIYFYIELPALNFRNEGFYSFLIILCVVFSISMILLQGFRSDSVMEYIHYTRKKLIVPFGIVILAIVVMLVGSAAGWVLFRAKSYSSLMPVTSGDFASEVSEIGWNQIPLLDEDSANNLANRKLGELSDLVSQFEVDGASAQINYKGNPVRVNYLNYSDFFKWWNNRSAGIPAYIRIDMRSQEVEVVRLQEGIKYSPSEYFNRNLMRHLRFHYPTLMFDDVNFEIDDEGTPYWIASVLTKRIGLFSGSDIKGAVLVNAVTGEMQYYAIEDVPSWVDRVFSSDLIVEQYDYYGKYHNGFLNSIFGQKDCTETTDGFNFIAQDDDVWLYTGITSVTGDRGNIGFILVNQRTKEARYYSCAGAEEYSAASSAEGAVQQFNYRATFPLLLNISDQPTYFMALKDAAGLVKMYAMVNVQQYQLVATGNTVSDCQQKYHALLVENQILTDEDAQKTDPDLELLTVSGKIGEIRSATIDGNTIYYIRLEKEKVYYTVSAKDHPMAVILNVGDQVKISCYESDESLIEAADLQMIG